MEINTEYNFLREILKYINHIQTTNSTFEKKKYFTKNNSLLRYLSFNNKITKDVIDYYNLYKIDNYILEQNPNFEIEWIKYYPKRKWNFNELSFNPNFKIKWVNLYPDQNWNFDELSSHNNFSIEWYEQYLDKNWNFMEISLHDNFSIEWYNKYPNLEWLLSITNSLKYDKNINDRTLKNYIEHIESKIDSKIFNKYLEDESIQTISHEESIICGKIKSQYCELSNNDNFNINWVRQYPNRPWNIYRIIFNLDFKIEWIEEFQELSWDFYSVQSHKNFKFEWVKKYPDKDWDFYNIKPELIDINFVKKYPDKNWKIMNIIEHPKFTEDIIKNNKNIFYKINYEVNINKYFNPKWFDEYPKSKWLYDKIEETHNFDVQWVLKYYNTNWPYIYDKNNYKKSYNKEQLKNEENFTILNFDKDFDIEWINKYPEKKWNYDIICLHPNFKIEWLNTKIKILEKYNYYLLSKNPNFKIKWLNNNLYEPWNYIDIIKNKLSKDNIRTFLLILNKVKSFEFIKNKSFLYSLISKHKYITIDIYNEFNVLWDYGNLIKN